MIMEEERKRYAYVLCIGDRIDRLITGGWCATEREMQHNKAAMCTAAQMFRETASILVYESTGKPYEYKYCSRCNVPNNLLIPEYVDIDGSALFYD